MITVTKSSQPPGDTVFEAPGGTRFIVIPTETRDDADDAAAIAGSESNVFAIRPSWSLPANEWIAADPVLWRKGIFPQHR